MKTSRITLNENEVAAILPGLEAIVNAIASACMGHFPLLDPRVQFAGINGSSVYAQAEFSATMAEHMLTTRNKLKTMNPSRKARLNCLELAAAAFALRMVQGEGLAPVDVLAKVPSLATKLEKYRRRAKRATIKEVGLTAYKVQSERWGRFLQWINSILCFRPKFKRFGGFRLFHRDRREQLLAFARKVAPTADPVRLRHLVDLAKRELLRERHPETLGMVVADDALGREFMARFIMERDGPDILAPQFQTLDVQQSAREEQLKSAMVLGGEDEPAAEVKVIKAAVEPLREIPEPSIPIGVSNSDTSDALPVPVIEPKPVISPDELAVLYAQWLVKEFDPRNWNVITRQTKREIFRPYHDHPRPINLNPAVSPSTEFRPTCLGLNAFEAIVHYSIWGSQWLMAKCSNPNAAVQASVEGYRLADERDRMIYGAQRDKLHPIYLRNEP